MSAALYEHLPHLLSRLRDTYPDIHPKLIEVSTNEQIAALSRNEIDIGFVHPPLGTDERLDVHGYPAEDLIAVLPVDRHTHGVTLTDIARHGLIMFPAAQGPALHARIMDTFTRAGLEVRIVQEAKRALTMLSLVAAGFGRRCCHDRPSALCFRASAMQRSQTYRCPPGHLP